MPYPPEFDQTYSYTGFQQAQGNGSFPGTQIDNDFANAESSIDGIIAFLRLAMRSDGTINPNALPPEYVNYYLAAQAAATAAANSAVAAGASAEAAAASALAAAASALAAALAAASVQNDAVSAMQFRSSLDRATARMISPEPVYKHIQLALSQSKSNGTNAFEILHGPDNPIDPDHAFTLQYGEIRPGDGTGSGDWQAGRAIVGDDFVPLHSVLGLALDPAQDWWGQTKPLGSTGGETVMPGIAYGWNRRAQDAGNGETRPKDDLVVTAGVLGGSPYAELKEGTIWFDQAVQQMRETHRIARLKGAAYQHVGWVMLLGTDDLGADSDSGDVADAPLSDLQTPEDFRDKILQGWRSLCRALSAVTGGQSQSILYIVGNGEGFDTTSPLTNGRVSAVKEGSRMACEAMPGFIRQIAEDYTVPTSDSLHYLGRYGYRQGVVIGEAMAANEMGIGFAGNLAPAEVRWNTSTEFDLIYDAKRGPWMVNQWTVNELAQVGGGLGWTAGMIGFIPGPDPSDTPCKFRALTVSGPGAILTSEIIHGGAYKNPLSGALTAYPLPTGTEIVNEGSGYGIDTAFYFTLDVSSSTYRGAAGRLIAYTNGSGVVDQVVPGYQDYNWIAPPTGPIDTIGGLGTGLQIQLTPAVTANATFTATHYCQFAIGEGVLHPFWRTTPGGTGQNAMIVDSSTGIIPGTYLYDTGVSDVLNDDPTQPFFRGFVSVGTVGTLDGVADKVTLLGLKSGGCFKYQDRQTGVVRFESPDGTQFVEVAEGPIVAFTSGGTTEIEADDVITGATSGATATVERVILSSGTWAGGDAAGRMILSGVTGTFVAENLDVGVSTNLATIAAAPTTLGLYGGWPVADTGSGGINVDDGTPKPPSVIGYEVVDSGGRAMCALRCTLDTAPSGPEVTILVAQRAYGIVGPAIGARTPFRPQPLAQYTMFDGTQPTIYPMPYAIRTRLPPVFVATQEPLFNNGSAGFWPSDIANPVVVSASGSRGAAGWWLKFGAFTSMRAAPISGEDGIRLYRAAGDTSGGNVIATITGSGPRVRRLRGRQVTMSFYARRGSTWAALTGTNTGLVATIYTNATVGTHETSTSIPAGAATLIAKNLGNLTEAWARYQVTTIGTAPLPADTSQITIRFLYDTNGNTSVEATDWVEITGVQFDEGSYARPLLGQTTETIRARHYSSTVGNALLTSIAALSPLAADKMIYTTGSDVAASTDFKIGTGTPAITFATVGDLKPVPGTSSFDYVRVGNRVFLNFSVQATPTWTTASGDFRITGLPFAAASGAVSAGLIATIGSATFATWTGTGTQLVLRTVASQTYLVVSAQKPAAGSANQTTTQMTSGNLVLIVGTIVYRC